MKKRKVLIIGTADNIGGAARVGWDMGRELKKRGWWVKYIVGYKKMDSEDVYDLKKNVFTEWLSQKTGYHLTSYFRHLRDFIFADDIDWGAEDEIFNHPWYKEAEIVHFQNLHGGYFKLKNLIRMSKEKKLVWTLHDMWPITAHCAYCYDCGSWNQGKHHNTDFKKYGAMLWDNSDYLWNKKKKIYSECDFQLISSSEWLNSYVKKSILQQFPSKVILNAVDTNIFKPANKITIRKELDLPLNKKIIAFINQGGVEDPRKGGGYFHQIAHHYHNDPSLLFLCIGGGKSRQQIENILYIPFILYASDLAKYYQASDLFLFTSLADNCPLVPLEALAVGLPVVSFDVGGVKEEILHKKNGYIAKYKDLEDLMNGVKYILGLKPGLVKRMVLGNRERAKKEFSLAGMADKVINIYGQLYD